MMKGLLGLIVLVLDIWAVLQVAQSNAVTMVKVLWIIVILGLPVLGLILWYFIGPKKAGA